MPRVACCRRASPDEVARTALAASLASRDKRYVDGHHTSAFFIAILVTVVMGGAPWWVIPWYVVMSVVTFVAYGWDKVSAQGGHWRTQEKTLHTLEMLGGWPGGWLALPLWRHKSRKESFKAEFQVAAAINVGCLLVLVIFGEELLGFLRP